MPMISYKFENFKKSFKKMSLMKIHINLFCLSSCNWQSDTFRHQGIVFYKSCICIVERDTDLHVTVQF